jgi:putative ABC transport system substrate-binding protein
MRRFVLGRLILALTIVGTLLPAATSFAAEPPRPGHVYRIGLLNGGTPDADSLKAFRAGMADLGWNEKNIQYVERWGNGRIERLPALAAELVSLKVDVIVAFRDRSTQEAMRATRQIPIVFPLGWDPEGARLVTSLARPGGNVTGLSLMAPDLYAKEFTLLKEAIPRLRKVGVIIDSTSPDAAGIARALQTAAKKHGVELKMVEILPLDGLDSRLKEMIGAGVQAITGYVYHGEIKERLIRLGIANRIPLAGYTDGLPGLLSLEVDEVQMVRRSAQYVDKILRGANPGELAVEQPTKFRLDINVATAKAFGIAIPQSLLLRADNLIQ